MLALYVDDLVVAATSQLLLKRIKSALMDRFKMKYLGALTYCLGLQVQRNQAQGNIIIHRSKYINEILQRFNMENAKPLSTPMALGSKLSKDDQPKTVAEQSEMESVPYKQAVGCLMYLTVWTRPDIAKAT